MSSMDGDHPEAGRHESLGWSREERRQYTAWVHEIAGEDEDWQALTTACETDQSWRERGDGH